MKTMALVNIRDRLKNLPNHYDEDPEICHIQGDELLCEAIYRLAEKHPDEELAIEIVELWTELKKWYA